MESVVISIRVIVVHRIVDCVGSMVVLQFVKQRIAQNVLSREVYAGLMEVVHDVNEMHVPRLLCLLGYVGLMEEVLHHHYLLVENILMLSCRTDRETL